MRGSAYTPLPCRVTANEAHAIRKIAHGLGISVSAFLRIAIARAVCELPAIRRDMQALRENKQAERRAQ